MSDEEYVACGMGSESFHGDEMTAFVKLLAAFFVAYNLFSRHEWNVFQINVVASLYQF